MSRKAENPLLVSAAALFAGAFVFGVVGAGEAQAEWKPTKTVEFIVPAGAGGGADQMARMIQGIVQKHKLMDQSLVRSEEHTSEIQSLMRISYAVFCLTKNKTQSYTLQ